MFNIGDRVKLVGWIYEEMNPYLKEEGNGLYNGVEGTIVAVGKFDFDVKFDCGYFGKDEAIICWPDEIELIDT